MKYRLLGLLTVVLLLSAVLLWWGHGHPRLVSKRKNTSTTAGTTSFNKQQHSLDQPASLWVVVNKNRPLNPIDYEPPDLVSVGNGQQMRAEAAAALLDLFAGAKAAGFTVLADSGYRSYEKQVSVYNHEVQALGQAAADTESAKPGYSEHQTGWAVDIGTTDCHLDSCFATAAAGKWVTAHAVDYGFVLRYDAAKVNSTGYRYEPWHFRYVGKPLATQLQGSHQTMEEFFGLPAVGAP